MDGEASKTLPWHAMAGDEAVRALASSIERGLSDAEASARLSRLGPNRLASGPRRRGVITLVAFQFRSILVALLVAASLLSALVGEWIDTAAIFAILLLNASLGAFQEYRAGEAIEALNRMVVRHATVIRDGDTRQVDAELLIPGDLIQVAAGDSVPADGRLVLAAGLQVSEAALTGESFPVAKRTEELPADTLLADRASMLYSGTVITSGRGRAVVTATGSATEFGRIGRLAESVERHRTPLEVGLDRVGRQMGIAAGIAALAVFVFSLLAGTDLLHAFMVAVALAVAAVPEGLPAIVTTVLALGRRRMAERHAIVRRLAAVETLGSTDVICSDKTGTMTLNELSVSEVWRTSTDVDEGDVRRLAGLALAPGATGPADPIDHAIAHYAGSNAATRRDDYRMIAEHPFDAAVALTSVVYQLPDDRRFAVVKGAPEAVFHHCTRPWGGVRRDASEQWRVDWREASECATEEMAQTGLRAIALACRWLPPSVDAQDRHEVEQDLALVALLGIVDAARPGVREAIARARRAGVRTVMVTGDHPLTARTIAIDLALAEKPMVATGRDLAGMSDDALVAALPGIDVFARVTSEDKLRIVRAFKRRGSVVAVTGDGVNDAPALREADVGVAMGLRGTDAARESAALVLTEDDYGSIVAAIEEGRSIVENIRRFLMYLLSGNLAEIIVVSSLAVCSGVTILPVQILWVNLVTDGLPALALGLEPPHPSAMERPPWSSRTYVFSRAMLPRIGLSTLLIAGGALAGYQIGATGGTPEEGRSLAFATLILGHILTALTLRNEHIPLFRLGLTSNIPLVLALGVSLLLQGFAFYVPPMQAALGTEALSLGEAASVTGFALPSLVVPELVKLARRPSGPSR